MGESLRTGSAVMVKGEKMRLINADSVKRGIAELKHRPYKDKEGDVWAPSWDDMICPYLCEDSFYNWMPEDDFFCKRGERREDG